MKRFGFSVLMIIATVCCAVFSVNAQSQNDKMARAYYFEAERGVSLEKYDDALTAITKAENLLGDANASTAAMKVKIYFGQQKYNAAKQALDNFYSFDAGDNLSREMASYLTRIDGKVAEENARIAAELRAVDEKAEQDRLASIAKTEQDRLAKIAAGKKARADRAQLHTNNITKCDTNKYGLTALKACYSLAQDYKFGVVMQDEVIKAPNFIIVRKDYDKAAYYYGVSCNKYSKSILGCNNRGALLEDGYGKSENPMAEAFDLYKHACENGDKTYGCYNLGRLYKSGVKKTYEKKPYTYIKPNTEEARAAYNKSCAAGLSEACKALPKLQKDNNEKLADLVASCSSGNIASCYTAGLWNYEGTRVKLDADKAAPLFKKACNLNNGDACYKLGSLKRDDRDYSAAKILFQKACSNYGHELACEDLQKLNAKFSNEITPLDQSCNEGKPSACLSLGKKYDDGIGIPLDDERAAGYFLKGCELGNAESCNIYGVMSRTSEGLPKDNVLAVDFFNKACVGGYFKGCSNLGEMYENGEGTEKNIAKAEQYFLHACRSKSIRGCDNLVDIYNEGKVNTLKYDVEPLLVIRSMCNATKSRSEKEAKKICGFVENYKNSQTQTRIQTYQKNSLNKLVKAINRVGDFSMQGREDNKLIMVKVKSKVNKTDDLCLLKSQKTISVTGEEAEVDTSDIDLRFTHDKEYNSYFNDGDYISYRYGYENIMLSEPSLETKTPHCLETLGCGKIEAEMKKLLGQIRSYHNYFCNVD